MFEQNYTIGVVVAMAAVTFALRALPFLASKWLKSHHLVERIGKFLPLAIMTLLVVHSAVDAAKSHANGPWFEVAALVPVIFLQWKTRQTLLSMCAGTLIYVLLRNYTG